MTILESQWFLALLAVLSAGLLIAVWRKWLGSRSAVLLIFIASSLLLSASLWNRQVGLHEDFSLAVERFLPSAIELDQLPALPTEAKDPDVMMVMLGVGSPQPLLGFLHAAGSTGFRREEPQGRFAVMFRDKLASSLLEDLKPHPPVSQRLVARWGQLTRDIPAEPGRALEAGGGTLRVVALYPDFEVRPDTQGRPIMGTRSTEPRDPWLEVEFLRAGRTPCRVLLSARQPDLTRRLNAPNLPEGFLLDYLRDGEELQSRFVVFTREDHRVSLVENGTVIRFETAATNRPFVVAPGLSVTALGFFDRFYAAPSTASGLPAVRLKVVDLNRQGTERAWLRPNDAVVFFRDKVHVTFLAPDKGSKGLRVEVRGIDERGSEWLPRVVELPESGDRILHLQRRPAAWLAWCSLVFALAGAVAGWVNRFRQPGNTFPGWPLNLRRWRTSR